MNAPDFIKFCENLRYYINLERMTPCEDPMIIGNRKYPVAKLGDLTLYLVHYKSLEEAQQKWNERKKRINWKKIVILNNDREGMTPELMERFKHLRYKKVMFTHLPSQKNSANFLYYIPGYEDKDCVGIITTPTGWLGKRPIDHFNWVDFLNKI